MPTVCVVVEQALSPDLVEDPGPLPLLKAAVGGARVADAGDAQGVPLHAGAQHQQDRVHDSPVGNARADGCPADGAAAVAARARSSATASPACASRRRGR